MDWEWIGNLPIVQAGKKLIDDMLKGIQEGWSAFTSWITEKVEWIKSLNRQHRAPLRSGRKGRAGSGNNGQDQSVHTAGCRERAMGGPVTAGRVYLVGERGPEFSPLQQSGQILSNSQTSNALSMAPTINISVTESRG